MTKAEEEGPETSGNPKAHRSKVAKLPEEGWCLCCTARTRTVLYLTVRYFCVTLKKSEMYKERTVLVAAARAAGGPGRGGVPGAPGTPSRRVPK